MLRTGFFLALLAFLTTPVFAQENRSEFSVQGTGLFTKTTSGGTYTYRPAKTGGFLTAYRYRLHRGLSAADRLWLRSRHSKVQLFGRGVQDAIEQSPGDNGLVEALPSFGKARFGPYILAGGGALNVSPRSNSLLGEERKRRNVRLRRRSELRSFPSESPSASNTGAWCIRT